jgi:HTH-type transcriptional regulator, sugar sensing transcriptional regulator
MQILEQIGLTQNETKVYLKLLELGTTTAGEIIKKAQLHRSKVYDTLERLIKKGLVSFVIKNKVKYFEASSPKNLLQLVEDREKEINDQKENLNKLIPILLAKKKISEKEEKVSLFEGNKGIRAILNEISQEKKEIHNIAAYSEDAEFLKYSIKYFMPKFYNDRKKNKIVMKYVFPEKSKKRAYEVKDLKYTQVRVFPSKFASSMSITIFGEKVAIIMWTKDPIGILIKDKNIAKNQENYFQHLWKSSEIIK